MLPLIKLNTKHKQLVSALFLASFLVFLPASQASAEDGRFFVKSTSNFWKTALGARHSFENGFSAELNDFQFRFAKLFGVKVESIPVFNILQSVENPVIAGPSESLPVKALNNAADVLLPVDVGSSDKTASKSEDVSETEGNGNGNGKGNKPPADSGDTSRNLPADQTPWGLEAVYNDTLIASASGGSGIVVAVLDTGIDGSHPDLIRRVSVCKDLSNFRKGIVEGKCDDQNGHGTHVAGIIAADAASDSLGLYGVAPEADLAIFKVCGNNGFCFADDIAVAIKNAVDEGANVINMSFGSDSNSSIIKNAVDYAYAKGVLMVAAAGNDGPFPDSIDYPAAYKEVVAVGAMGSTYEVMDWSSRGVNSDTEEYVVEDRDIEFVMPGENIESTWRGGGYAILSGTSMASPFAAGLAAKLWQPDGMESTRALLQSLSLDLEILGDDNASGFGLPRLNN